MSRPGGRRVLLSELVVVQRGCSQQAILAELRRVILGGAVQPGTAIALDAVAELFGVSRIPVREALKTLVGEDLVEHRTNAGYFVAGLTSGELRQLYLVREALEAAVLPEAARRARPEDHRQAAAAHQALGEAVPAGDSRSHHRESRRFHLALVAPARMHRLQAMFESAWNVTEPMQPMGHIRAGDAMLLHADHQLMLDAFVSRDVAALLAAGAEHHQGDRAEHHRQGRPAGHRRHRPTRRSIMPVPRRAARRRRLPSSCGPVHVESTRVRRKIRTGSPHGLCRSAGRTSWAW